ncbi:MAG: DUF4956 domain-containing protein [bacterium]
MSDRFPIRSGLLARVSAVLGGVVASSLVVGAALASPAASPAANSAASAEKGLSEAAPSINMLRSTLHETPEERLQHALHQFTIWQNWVEMILAVGLAVALASLLAYHPRATRRRDLAAATEERKTLVILGVIGAVVSALVLIDQAMAFVIFGIGSLIRFRTVIGNPHMTGRAILVVVIGLACGLTQYTTAIIVAGAGWLVIWWLHARRAAELKVRVPIGADRMRAQMVAAEALRAMHCRVLGQRVGASGRSFTIAAQVPSGLGDELVSQSLASTLAPDFGRVDVELRSE